MTKPAQTNAQEPPEKHPQICRFAAVSSSRPHFVSQMDADCLVPKEREKQSHQIGANRRNLRIKQETNDE